MRRLGNRGVSLVEAVVATLIMSLGALLLAGGFMAATTMMDHANSLQRSGETAAGALEGGDVAGTGSTVDESAKITLRIGGQTFTIAGKLEMRESTENPDVHFYRFRPTPK